MKTGATFNTSAAVGLVPLTVKGGTAAGGRVQVRVAHGTSPPIDRVLRGYIPKSRLASVYTVAAEK